MDGSEHLSPIASLERRHSGRERSGLAHIATWIGLALAGAVVAVIATELPAEHIRWLAWDSRAYWDAGQAADPYAAARIGALGAYLYSPAFLGFIAPATMLPWPIFLFVWAAISIGAAIVLIRRAPSQPALLWVPLAALALLDIWSGNINLLLACAIVAGFRWPAAWSALLLTKVTPGLGVLWFAVRREWRNLAIALGATIAIVAVSLLLDVGAWISWFGVLTSNVGVDNLSGEVPIPAHVRFPVAALLIVWGALTNRRWVLPIACILLLPVIWPPGLAILLASAALLGAERRSHDTASVKRAGAA